MGLLNYRVNRFQWTIFCSLNYRGTPEHQLNSSLKPSTKEKQQYVVISYFYLVPISANMSSLTLPNIFTLFMFLTIYYYLLLFPSNLQYSLHIVRLNASYSGSFIIYFCRLSPQWLILSILIFLVYLVMKLIWLLS